MAGLASTFSLFDTICPSCGLAPTEKAGLCLPCYRRAYHNRVYFGGHRDAVLERDGHACRICGNTLAVIVHHRTQISEPEWMIAICRRCHVPIHHLCSIRGYLEPLLIELWREQHPHQPVQLQFDLAA